MDHEIWLEFTGVILCLQGGFLPGCRTIPKDEDLPGMLQSIR